MADRNKTIGVRIARVREKAGDKQADLAAALGVKREMVTYWENGTRAIKAEMLLSIADRYGVNADYLLGRTDEATVKEDIRISCKTTGLSQRAIENTRRDDTKALSHILEDDNLLGLLEDVADLYHRTGALIAKIEEINATGITADGIDALDYMYRCVRLEKNDIQNTFGAIVERLVQTNDTLSAAKAILREYGRA